MAGKCPKCETSSNIVVEHIRAREEIKKTTVPALQFLCDHCRTILSVTLDPEWQAQIMAGQLRAVGEGADRTH